MKTKRRGRLMGRWLAGIAVAGLVLGLPACGSGTGSGSNQNNSAPSSGY
jgi:hypothetical protein